MRLRRPSLGWRHRVSCRGGKAISETLQILKEARQLELKLKEIESNLEHIQINNEEEKEEDEDTLKIIAKESNIFES